VSEGKSPGTEKDLEHSILDGETGEGSSYWGGRGGEGGEGTGKIIISPLTQRINSITERLPNKGGKNRLNKSGG